MSLQTLKAVYAANEQQYTALGGTWKFKYLGLVFTSDGRQNMEVDRRIGKTNAVLCELYSSAVTKRDLSNFAKLSMFESVFSILTYGHDSCVMTKKILFHVQATETGFGEEFTVCHFASAQL